MIARGGKYVRQRCVPTRKRHSPFCLGSASAHWGHVLQTWQVQAGHRFDALLKLNTEGVVLGGWLTCNHRRLGDSAAATAGRRRRQR